MRYFAILLACVLPAAAAERVDNVLSQMVPDGSTTLVGMRMDQLKSTPLFQKMVAQEKLPQLDQFARESGFDPRRDVRDLLLASNGKQTVLLARGTFHLTLPPTAKRFNYHGYAIVSNAGALPNPELLDGVPGHSAPGGFCILDATLAAAGPLPALEAALDQYKSGKRDNAAALLGRARSIPETYQFWAVTKGNASFIPENMPGVAAGPGGLFRSMQNTLFEADLRTGLKATGEGYCLSAQDAKTLSDALRGMVGMGRLNTPENQPDLLRFWDGIKVEQVDKKVTLTADIGQDLIDQLLKLLQTNSGNRKPRIPPGGPDSPRR